ncbi:MAG: dipeptidase [Myxococcota bacterium]|nr:dipeptidase [Myxococcota bacterium]
MRIRSLGRLEQPRLKNRNGGCFLQGLFLLVLGTACGNGETADPALVDSAEELHRSAIVVDTHSDTTPRFEDPEWDFMLRHPLADGHMDLPRIREGGLDVQFWSIYMGKKEREGEAIEEALQRIDAVHQLVEQNPEQLGLAMSVAEIREHVAAGRLASVMGVEGGHIIENDLAVLRTYHRLGVRYMTLTHSFHTDWADSSGTSQDLEPLHGGLSLFGEEVVLEMNRMGMMVDISHVSDETFWDVLRVSRAPVMASHSSVRKVANHRRNIDDEMLRALAENGGVIMINFFPGYIDDRVIEEGAAYSKQWGETLAKIPELHEDPESRAKAYRDHFRAHPLPETSLAVLLDHFDHAIAVAGPDHVGIGADWDGVPSMPVGMEDVTDLPALTEGLLARGHSPKTIRKVLGENLLRVMAEVEVIGEQMREAG